MKKAKKSETKNQSGQAANADGTQDGKQAQEPGADAQPNAAEGQAEASPVEEPQVVELPPRDAKLEERLLRLQADFDNFRKRTLREKEDLYRRANEDIMRELLPVLDHLELAFSAAGSDGDEHPVIQGFSLVAEQLRAVLRKFGLRPIEAQGAFDPNVHEAVQHLPSAEVAENEVIAQLRAGYMLGNRLLRAAQVVVSSGPPEPDAEDAAQETGPADTQ